MGQTDSQKTAEDNYVTRMKNAGFVRIHVWTHKKKREAVLAEVKRLNAKEFARMK